MSAQVYNRLLTALPEVGTGRDADEETRAVLRPLLERVVRISPSLFRQRRNGEGAGGWGNAGQVDGGCPNCGASVESVKTPYCNPMCRDFAAFVRRYRAHADDGSIADPEQQIIAGESLWKLLGGGFPRRQSRVKPDSMAKVIERDGGVCHVCGTPATGVDHVGSG